MPTFLPSRRPAAKAEYEFSPVLTVVAAALDLALVSMEAQMLGGSEGASGTLLPSKTRQLKSLEKTAGPSGAPTVEAAAEGERQNVSLFSSRTLQ